jgi:membrane-bound ClpP family serine protease
LIFLIIRKNSKLWIEDERHQLLATIVTWCMGIALFLTLSEVVIELYARTEHANGLYYLMFGLHGSDQIWCPGSGASLALMLVSFVLLLMPAFSPQGHEATALGLRARLCRHLDRKGHGPGGAGLHPLAHRRGVRVLPDLRRSGS